MGRVSQAEYASRKERFYRLLTGAWQSREVLMNQSALSRAALMFAANTLIVDGLVEVAQRDGVVCYRRKPV